MTLWDPENNYAEARRGRKRRGLGPEGLARIREDLKEFKEPLYDEVDEGPPEEPPEEESGPERPRLPPPEYISNILQAEWPSGTDTDESRFRVLRPDKDSKFYGQGSSRSTRVHAIQWIPTDIDEYGRVTGDIFVAFARPSKSVGSSLFLYASHDVETWDSFKSSGSLGVSVKSLLGTAISKKEMDEKEIENYKRLHPIHSSWIFDSKEMIKWTAIRPGNSIEGEIPFKSLKEFEASLASSEALKKRLDELKRGRT